VMHDAPDGVTLFGAPAQPEKQFWRQAIITQRLPELLKRIADLEKRLGDK